MANSLPAINDITAAELRSMVAKAAEVCPVIRAARDAAVAAEAANGGRIPPVPGAPRCGDAIPDGRLALAAGKGRMRQQRRSRSMQSIQGYKACAGCCSHLQATTALRARPARTSCPASVSAGWAG